jgi:hypothetical protein
LLEIGLRVGIELLRELKIIARMLFRYGILGLSLGLSVRLLISICYQFYLLMMIIMFAYRNYKNIQSIMSIDHPTMNY